MASVSRTVRIDAAMNEKLNAMLSSLGITLDEFFVRDVRETLDAWELPPSPYLSTAETLEADLQRAEEARLNGVPFIPAEQVLARMERIILEAEERGA